MAVQRARSVEEYVEWVKEAVFEVDDLRDCLEYEMEELGRFPAFLDPLEKGIKGVYRSMCDGNYSFGREDLPFMGLAVKHAAEVPFHTLLERINETHRKGIDTDAADG
jgi:hypothetical protein